MAFVNMLNILKFVQYLKCMNDLSPIHQQDGIEGASSDPRIGTKINDEELIGKPINIYLSKTKFEVGENIVSQNHVFR